MKLFKIYWYILFICVCMCDTMMLITLCSMFKNIMQCKSLKTLFDNRWVVTLEIVFFTPIIVLGSSIFYNLCMYTLFSVIFVWRIIILFVQSSNLFYLHTNFDISSIVQSQLDFILIYFKLKQITSWLTKSEIHTKLYSIFIHMRNYYVISICIIYKPSSRIWN